MTSSVRIAVLWAPEQVDGGFLKERQPKLGKLEIARSVISNGGCKVGPRSNLRRSHYWTLDLFRATVRGLWMCSKKSSFELPLTLM